MEPTYVDGKPYAGEHRVRIRLGALLGMSSEALAGCLLASLLMQYGDNEDDERIDQAILALRQNYDSKQN